MYNIGIIGAGRVGKQITHLLIGGNLNLCNYLYIYNHKKGKAESIKDGLMVEEEEGFKVVDSLDEIIEKTEIIIITAGKHEPIRVNAFEENNGIMEYYGKKFSGVNDKLYIIVSNPVDENAYVFYKESGLPKERVIGFNHLDWMRLRYSIYILTEVKLKDIEGFVVGPHNPFMVPVFSRIVINGINFYNSGLLRNKEYLTEKLKMYAPNQIKKGGTSTRVDTTQGMIQVLNAINNQKDYVCMSYLTDCFAPNVFLGWPIKFKGLDAIPFVNNRYVDDIRNFLNKEERSNFVKAYDNSIKFLRENKAL